MIKEQNASEPLPEVRFFDLYENQKANLRDYQHNCKDSLDNSTNFGYYCIDCRISYCDICYNQIHDDHVTIKKSLYDVENGVIENVFSELQTELVENPTIQNPNELAKKMREKLEEQCNAMHQKIEEFKEKKIQEIISYEVLCPPAADLIQESIKVAQTDLKNFFRRHKKFFHSERFNNDQENAIFLLSFDILNEINVKNKDLVALMTRMQKSAVALEETMNTKTEEFYKSIEQLVDEVDNAEYQDGVREISEGITLMKDQDNFADAKSKMKKYDKFIDSFKELVFKQISKLGNVREFEKLTKQYDKMHKKVTSFFGDIDSSNVTNNSFQDLLVDNNKTNLNQSIVLDDNERSTRRASRKPSMANDNYGNTNNTSDIASPRRLNKSRSVTSVQRDNSKGKSDRRPSTDSIAPETEKKPKNDYSTPTYKNKNEIILENRIIQRFFAYSCLDLTEKEFKFKEKKESKLNASGLLNTTGILSTAGGLEAIPEIPGEIDEEDVCKPLAGTTEIQIYDRKKRYLFKQEVKLDKKKFGYVKFPPGVRYTLVEDTLFINGGKDEFTDLKVFLCFNIKSYELKRLPDMINARSYHSVQYDADSMCIIVIGGQKNGTCELYHMQSSKWKALPNLNVPRANVSIFNDGSGYFYSFFGMEGDISKSEDYSDVVEVMKVTSKTPKWLKVEYLNKSKLIFKKVYLEIFPLSNDKILIYGGKNLRTREKKEFAIFLLKRNEVYKVDRMILDYLRLGV
jgi:hypothetical protein